MYLNQTKMNTSSRFDQTRKEIEAAYATQNNARRLYYEYNSKYRRIIVIGEGSGFVIETSYKGFAKEFNKEWSTRWGVKEHAIAWAKCYSENRNIRCGNLTIIEEIGKQII